MDEARRKARLRLWLRSERAMGLASVRRVEIRRGEAAETPVQVQEERPAAGRPTGEGSLRKDAAAVAPVEVVMPVATQRPEDGPPTAPFAAPPLPRQQRIVALQAMDEREVKGCTRCRLCETRTNTVFGEGDPEARIFFIGEGPGETEDLRGRPFVGRAGEKLNEMINAMGLKREQVYIANIVKCRPPKNRAPVADETAACTPYLERQLEIVRPEVIVTLGLPATQYMLKTKLSMGRLRGRWHLWRGIKLMPTYHPAYMLRYYTREIRGAVWSDLQQVMQAVGLSERG